MESKNDVAILMDDKQLRRLAKILLIREEPLMANIDSEPERIKYLKQCREAYDNVISLLEDANDIKSKYEDHKTKSDVAESIHNYLKYFMNMSMQCIRNCCLRASAVSKVRTHYADMKAKLVNVEDKVEIERLLNEAKIFEKETLEIALKSRSGSARVASKLFSQSLKDTGTTFPEMLNDYKNRLGYTSTEFEGLEDIQKVKVYNSIIRDSERAAVPENLLESLGGGAGVAVLLVCAGLMVWDIFTVEHQLETILRDSLSTISEIGAFTVQVLVEAAVTEAVVDIEIGEFIVALAGLVVGTASGFLFIAASGILVDLILGSGGKNPPPVEGQSFYSAVMPDGMAIAYRIAYDGEE